MRYVPPDMQAELDTGCTTYTDIILIEPLTPGYEPFGISALDKDLTYDDGNGEVLYSAAIGVEQSNLQSVSDMGVDNSTANHLIPEFDIPFSNAELASGILDYAWYTRYRINYNNLTPGRHIVIDHGQCGQMKILQGMTFVNEMTSLAKLLKSNLVEKDSITCRAQFGSQPLGTVGADITEKFPCTKAYTWLGPYTVTTPGAEPNNHFTASAMPQATDYFRPGMIKWVTGANAGRQSEVDDFTSGGVIELKFETMFPIQADDTFQIRKDCTKWVYGANGCQEHFSSDAPDAWKGHYRGEPFIPIADADAINTPGATVGSSV